MAKRQFRGTFAEIKNLLAKLPGEWKELSASQKQFRSPDGGILNWFPTTGTLSFQGSANATATLEDTVIALLEAVGTTILQGNQNPASVSPVLSTPELPSASDVRNAVPDYFLARRFSGSELIIGLVGPVGTKLSKIAEILESRLLVTGYGVENVRISRDIIPRFGNVGNQADEFERISGMMDAGNDARRKAGDNSVLALGVAAWIASKRKYEDGGQPEPYVRRAYVVNSLKHPDEVLRLRDIYPQGFYLIGVDSDSERRRKNLEDEQRISSDKVTRLMARDEDENLECGQRVADTFHMSDFFVRMDADEDKLNQSLWRILDIVFGHPYITPTFDEHAMFMAFSAALRSADLSRQVGAVVAQDREIIATGANECPQFGGGLYWPEYQESTKAVEDKPRGRDYKRGFDANREEQAKIVNEIVAKLADLRIDQNAARNAVEQSSIRDLTEFGRVVHAEMEALLCCARNQLTTKGGTLYCTTFPCHNCAKHIVAAGIKRVVYIEPYPKSKAALLQDDAIALGLGKEGNFVCFEPFVGVGPRRFFDLFSMRLGSGYPLKRKDQDGRVVEWRPENARLRIQMLPCSYLDLEQLAGAMFESVVAGEGRQK